MNTELRCDGRCFAYHSCSGDVRKVEVFCHYGDDINEYRGSCGIFNYCQTAIETDTKNGFYVKVLAQ